MNIYQRGHHTALRMLKKYGASYPVKRDGKHWVDDETGKEHHEAETEFLATGVKVQYKPHDIDGTLILATDIKMVFSPDSVIQKGDRVFVEGVWLRVQEPNPIKPAELVICYQSQLRV